MDTIYLQESIIESKSTTRNVISNTIRYFIAVEMSFSKGRYFRDGGGGGGVTFGILLFSKENCEGMD